MDDSTQAASGNGFLNVFVPNATVFVAGACIMIVELTAGRIISRYLGQSLYTWTSVIGVVLAGISIGNYLGGLAADRFEPRKSLCVLFALSSLACLTVPVVNHAIGYWSQSWDLSWPARIFTHVLVTFLFPSVMLGTISPVVAKLALSLRPEVGRTIGGVYAWGAAGSILGTFLAGFYLIAALGTVAVVIVVAMVLAGISLLYGLRSWLARSWMLLCVLACFLALAPGTASLGKALCLRDPLRDQPEVVYWDESQYSAIAVKVTRQEGPVHSLYLDKMMHSKVDLSDPTLLLYTYAWIYDGVLDAARKPGEPIRAIVMGGGAYTFPRYLAETRPGSVIDVAEIDPAVTEAARAACGLEDDPSIRIHHMDARNFVADQLRRKRAGEEVPSYDYVFGDTVNDYAVPFHLTTDEFNHQLSELLAEDGIYLLNMIDMLDSGRFLGSVVRTCRRTFAAVHVFTSHRHTSGRDTYVVVASKAPIDLSGVVERIRARHPFSGRLLGAEQMDELAERPGTVLLTDDHAPVENLLAAVVKADVPEGRDVHFLRQGIEAAARGDLAGARELFEKTLAANPENAEAHYNLGMVLLGEGKKVLALASFERVLDIEPSYVRARMHAGVLLAGMGQMDPAIKHFEVILREAPDNIDARVNLAKAFFVKGDREQALRHLGQGLALAPDSAVIHNMMGELLAVQGRTSEAVEHFADAVRLDPNLDQARRNLEKWKTQAVSP